MPPAPSTQVPASPSHHFFIILGGKTEKMGTRGSQREASGTREREREDAVDLRRAAPVSSSLSRSVFAELCRNPDLAAGVLQAN